jgi:GT2 family glycosyltransferase
MAAYNAETYLAPAVNSILRQSFTNFEFVIVDDGSTDGTRDILESYARRDSRIRVATQANAGVAAALNAGLARVRGEFIARMDADDISLPTRLDAQLDFMKAHPDCVAVGCRWLAIDPDGWPIRIGRQPQSHEAIDAFHLAGNGGGMPGPALFLRRSAVEAVGRYRAEFVLAEDYDLLLRLAEVGRLVNLPDVLFFYREHATSLLRTRRDELKQLTWKAQKEAHERRRLAYDRPPPPPVGPLTQNLHMRWARYALAAEYFGTARRHAWRQFLQTRSARPLRLLADATVRQAAEPWLWIYDLLRARRPRSRSRVNDPIRSERLVREFAKEMAAGVATDRPSTAACRESYAGAPERRADRDASCGCAAVRGDTGEVPATRGDICVCAAGAARGG